MFFTNLPRLGEAFLLLTTIVAMVESQHGSMGMSTHGPMDMDPPVEECCAEKMVGSVSYTLAEAPFRGAIPHQCLNDCVYTVTGTSSPKFCFQRGDLPTECLSDAPVIELVGGSGPHEGNVMIRGQPVCDDDWGGEDALVVCRQLGYNYGFPTDNSFFGPVSEDFAMDEVECTGDEEYIWRCPHETEDDCGGDEGAGVICSNEPPMMTTGDQGSGSGSGIPVWTTADPGSGSGSGSVDVWVHAKSATSGDGLADASVEFQLGDLMLTGNTDVGGWVVFSVSPDVVTLGLTATIIVSKEGYVTVEVIRVISATSENYISVFSSPELAEGEHRLVLTWDTTTDLDVYALQKNKSTGEIVCKTYWVAPGGCAGVNLDIDVWNGPGPETITWTDADNDAYIYELYVHDYNQGGVAGTGASITLYGETTVEMSVTDGDSGDIWWMLGTFEPSVGTSSFSTMDYLQSSDPDTSASSRSERKKKPE